MTKPHRQQFLLTAAGTAGSRCQCGWARPLPQAADPSTLSGTAGGLASYGRVFREPLTPLMRGPSSCLVSSPGPSLPMPALPEAALPAWESGGTEMQTLAHCTDPLTGGGGPAERKAAVASATRSGGRVMTAPPSKWNGGSLPLRRGVTRTPSGPGTGRGEGAGEGGILPLGPPHWRLVPCDSDSFQNVNEQVRVRVLLCSLEPATLSLPLQPAGNSVHTPSASRRRSLVDRLPLPPQPVFGRLGATHSPASRPACPWSPSPCGHPAAESQPSGAGMGGSPGWPWEANWLLSL